MLHGLMWLHDLTWCMCIFCFHAYVLEIESLCWCWHLFLACCCAFCIGVDSLILMAWWGWDLWGSYSLLVNSDDTSLRLHVMFHLHLIWYLFWLGFTTLDFDGLLLKDFLRNSSNVLLIRLPLTFSWYKLVQNKRKKNLGEKSWCYR